MHTPSHLISYRKTHKARDMNGMCSRGIAEVLNGCVYGNGAQTLVLSHGFGTDQSVWHYIVPYLAVFFKVVVYDLAFSSRVSSGVYNATEYGRLEGYAEDLVCVLEEMNVKRAVFVGHSMSAMIGCLAATWRPDLFESLVLLNASPRYLNAKGYNGGFEKSDVDLVFKAIREDYSGWVQSFCPTAIGLNETSAITELERSFARMKPEVVLSVAEAVFLSDLRWVLPEVPVPCSIIQSKKDAIVPTSVGHYLKNRIGNGTSRLFVLRTQGHFPQLTAYPLLLKALKGVIHFNTCSIHRNTTRIGPCT